MGYFPLLIKIENKKILVIGAGNIAYRKISKIFEFSKNITVIASNIDKNVNEFCQDKEISLIKKDFEEKDLAGFDIVIAAIDNISLQKDIFNMCKKRDILYNCVDIQECCDFIFPSIIKEGDLTISISTNGSSPSFTKRMNRFLKQLLPNDVGSFLQEMKSLRNSLPKGKERMKLLDKKVSDYFESWKK